MSRITMKELIEHYFNKHIPLPNLYSIKSGKTMHNRTIESYDPETCKFKLNKCKETFCCDKPENITFEITIESRDSGWADLVCGHFFGKTFEQIQTQVYWDMNDDNTTVIGSRSMKYSASKPRVTKLLINDLLVNAIATYSTVTNIGIEGGYYCGHTYSNTSTKWAYEAGLVNHYAVFNANSECDD